MEFTELIAERRSIRKYEAAVSREEMEVILTAARQAPSWKTSKHPAAMSWKRLKSWRSCVRKPFRPSTGAAPRMLPWL